MTTYMYVLSKYFLNITGIITNNDILTKTHLLMSSGECRMLLSGATMTCRPVSRECLMFRFPWLVAVVWLGTHAGAALRHPRSQSCLLLNCEGNVRAGVEARLHAPAIQVITATQIGDWCLAGMIHKCLPLILARQLDQPPVRVCGHVVYVPWCSFGCPAA